MAIRTGHGARCARLARLIAAAGLAVSAGAHAATAPAEIERSESLAVDGAKLYLEIRGDDARAPVLLWLHGGPGGAERPLFRYFDGGLERSFVVVYWDQRGAGRSADPDADPRRLTVARHLADLDAVVQHLKRSLGRERVIPIGHSWGGALGLLYAHAHPDEVAAVVAVDPLVATQRSERAEYDFVLAAAARRGDEDEQTRLRQIGPPPYPTSDARLAVERIASRYGAVYHREPSRIWTVLQGVLRGLVTPWEIPRFIRANEVSLRAMHQELAELDLTRSVPRLEVPVVFLLGRYDRHVSARVAADYFASLRAPAARLVWFEDSAHNVPFEEPRLFQRTVVDTLRSVGVPVGGHDARAPRPEVFESLDCQRSRRACTGAGRAPPQRAAAQKPRVP